jgi:hypothetical protein
MADVAGTVTFTEITHGTVKKIKAAWVAGQGIYEGTASGTTTNQYDGRILGAITVPGTGVAPTDNYDIAVNDSDGVDVALGALADRDATATEFRAEATMAGVAHSKLTVAITNAGSAATGTLYLLIR